MQQFVRPGQLPMQVHVVSKCHLLFEGQQHDQEAAVLQTFSLWEKQIFFIFTTKEKDSL